MADLDPRVELAVERTTLAWIRTGLSMMGFGFVVARFGLFLRELAAARGGNAGSHGLSLWSGVALVGLGIASLVVAMVRHGQMLRRLRSGETSIVSAGPGTVIAGALAAVGLLMIVFLITSSR